MLNIFYILVVTFFLTWDSENDKIFMWYWQNVHLTVHWESNKILIHSTVWWESLHYMVNCVMEIMLLIFSAAKLLQYSLINNVSFIFKKLHYTNYFLELKNGEFNFNNMFVL